MTGLNFSGLSIIGRRCVTMGLAGLMLASCAVAEIATRQPATIYELTPKSTFDGDMRRESGSILVETPTANAGLNNARIALRPDPTRIDYYAEARWADVLPVMVETLIRESFDNSQKINVIAANSLSARADYALLPQIREFQAEYDQGIDFPPLVKVHIQAKLVTLPRRETLITVDEEASLRAEGTGLPFIISTFDETFGKVQKRLVTEVIRKLNNSE